MTDTFHISYARALRGVITFGHYQLGLLKLSQGLGGRRRIIMWL